MYDEDREIILAGETTYRMNRLYRILGGATLYLVCIIIQPTCALAEEHPDAAAIQNIMVAIPLAQTQERVNSISAYFLGRPFRLGPLGEGPRGVYDQDPLCRFDCFDCLTFVETVMACALSQNIPEAESQLQQIRYAGGKVGYGTRNHFTALDWIPNNQKDGLIEDITAAVAGNGALSLADALIDRQAWYACRTPEDLQLPGLSPADLCKRLIALQSEGKIHSPVQVRLPYLPLHSIFKPAGKEGRALLDPRISDRIPSGAIVCIVRPNWFLPQIGTPIHISHLGFAVWQGNRLYFRHATSAGSQQIVDVLLEDYLRGYLDSPTVKGIIVLKILPPATVKKSAAVFPRLHILTAACGKLHRGWFTP
ncbi:DUF1460 domain-containing protein [candidate division FCPU426 bacterium]|nr:DUF1460 domain-containing protein [candidate division FCPU426 bacterium]